MARRLVYGARKFVRGSIWLTEAIASVTARALGVLWTQVKAAMPVIAVAVPAGLVLGYDLKGSEATQTFLFVAIPLLVMSYLFDQRHRR